MNVVSHPVSLLIQKGHGGIKICYALKAPLIARRSLQGHAKNGAGTFGTTTFSITTLGSEVGIHDTQFHLFMTTLSIMDLIVMLRINDNQHHNTHYKH